MTQDGINLNQFDADGLSPLALKQREKNHLEDFEQQMALQVIGYLKHSILMMIGLIIIYQVYSRFFYSATGPSNRGSSKQVAGSINKQIKLSQQNSAPNTRTGRNSAAAGLSRQENALQMLLDKKFPEEQLSTLKNTVANQAVKELTKDANKTAWEERAERRKQINRPKRSVKFNLNSNMTREFRKDDVVEVKEGSAEPLQKSSERNKTCTPGRLVKIEKRLDQ